MKSIFKSLASNTLIFAIGNSASLILAFFMVPFYTKMLSPSEFGISDIIATTVAMLAPLVSLNVFAAIFRFALDDHEHSKLFTNGLGVTSVGAIITLLLTGILHIFHIKYALLVGVYLVVTLFFYLFQNFIRGINHVKRFAISGIVATITNIVSNIVLMAIFKLGLHGYLYSLIISLLAASLFLFFLSKLYRYVDYKQLDYTVTSNMLHYAVPMIPNSFAWWLTNDANKLIILFFLGPGANGILAVANKIPNLMNTVFGMFANAWQMTAVKTAGTKDASRVYALAFYLVFGILLIGCGIAVLLIKPFMSIYVSSQFFSAWKIIPILLLTAWFSNISAFFGISYMVAKKTTGLITTTFWGMAINIVLCIALVPLIGLNGSGLAGTIGFFIVSLLRFYQTQKFVAFKINFKFFTSLLVGYIALSIAVLLDFNAIAFLILLLMFLVYGISAYRLKTEPNITNVR